MMDNQRNDSQAMIAKKASNESPRHRGDGACSRAWR